jgi:flagellin-like hook-associated protein FlgL|tara:strand:+ start:1295 stop:1744 length:450 start_codon:yes stop_codon:yes gene_type:complete
VTLDAQKTLVSLQNNDMSLNTSIHNANLTTSDEIRVNSVIIDKSKDSDSIKLSGNFNDMSEQSKILDSLKVKIVQIHMTSDEDRKQNIKYEIDNLLNKFSNMTKNPLSQNVDYKKESLDFDKNNISSLSGSFIKSQGNINQNNALELLA